MTVGPYSFLGQVKFRFIIENSNFGDKNLFMSCPFWLKWNHLHASRLLKADCLMNNTTFLGCVSLVGRDSSVVGTSLRNLGKSVYPTLPVFFGWETISRRSGVYARGSKRSLTGGKCVVNLSWTPHSSLVKDNSQNQSWVSPGMRCLEYLYN